MRARCTLFAVLVSFAVAACHATSETQDNPPSKDAVGRPVPAAAPDATASRPNANAAAASSLGDGFEKWREKLIEDLKIGRAKLMRSGRSVFDPNYDPNEVPPPDILPISVALVPPSPSADHVTTVNLELVNLPHENLPATIIESGDASIGTGPLMPRKTELALIYRDPATYDWKPYATGKLSPTDLANLRTAAGKLSIERVSVTIAVTLEAGVTIRPDLLYAEWRCITRARGAPTSNFSACLVPTPAP